MDDIIKIKNDLLKDINRIAEETKNPIIRAENDLKIVKNKSNEMIKKVDELITDIPELILSRLKKKISSASSITTSVDKAPFNEFLFYIDNLKNLNMPSYIYDRNPTFCNSIMDQIVVYYQKLMRYISIKLENAEKAVSNAESDRNRKIKNIVTELIETRYTKLINTLAQHEANLIVEKAQNEFTGNK